MGAICWCSSVVHDNKIWQSFKLYYNKSTWWSQISKTGIIPDLWDQIFPEKIKPNWENVCRESGDNQGEKLLEVRKNFFKKGKGESIGQISGKLFFFFWRVQISYWDKRKKRKNFKSYCNKFRIVTYSNTVQETSLD